MANDNYIHRTDFTPKSYAESSTTDISASETYGCCWFVGVYYTKPNTTPFTIVATLTSGEVVTLLSVGTGVTNGYESMGNTPIPEGTTLAVVSTGGVSGSKNITLLFLPNRGQPA